MMALRMRVTYTNPRLPPHLRRLTRGMVAVVDEPTGEWLLARRYATRAG